MTLDAPPLRTELARAARRRPPTAPPGPREPTPSRDFPACRRWYLLAMPTSPSSSATDVAAATDGWAMRDREITPSRTAEAELTRERRRVHVCSVYRPYGRRRAH